MIVRAAAKRLVRTVITNILHAMAFVNVKDYGGELEKSPLVSWQQLILAVANIMGPTTYQCTTGYGEEKSVTCKGNGNIEPR